MCSSMLSLIKSFSYILSRIVHTANIEIRECVKWSSNPKKWSRSSTGGARLLKGCNCKGLTGKILVFWIGGRLCSFYVKWSLTRGGRTWRFDCAKKHC